MEYHNRGIKDLNRFPMQVLSLTHCKLDSSWRSDNSRAHFTRIYLPISGEGQVCCEGQELRLTPGNVYLIPADTQYAYRCDDALEKLFIHIVIPRYDRNDLFHGHKAPIVFPDTCGYRTQLQTHMGSSFLDSLRIRACLLSIVAQAVAVTNLPDPDMHHRSPLVENALTFIDSNLSSRLCADDVSQAVHISASTLQKRFRAETGIPMGRYINDRLLTSAANALYTTDLSIREVSEQLGFCDQFYFSKRFSQHYGISPYAYRKSFRPDRILYDNKP